MGSFFAGGDGMDIKITDKALEKLEEYETKDYRIVMEGYG